MKIRAKIPPAYAEPRDVTPVIGKTFNEEGIFLGCHELHDWTGKKLGLFFNVFAAPKDLTDENGKKVLWYFDDAVKRVAKLENWHGHDGAHCSNSGELATLLLKEGGEGKWVIPPFEFLCGRDDVTNERVLENHLYAYRDQGDFAGTFPAAVADAPPDHPSWYWSCSWDYEVPDYADAVRMTDATTGVIEKDRRLSCRPIRFVRVKPEV